MRVPQSPSSSTDQRRTVGGDGGGGGGGCRDRDRDRDRDAESLFRTKPISEIRNVEGSTRNQIQEKSMELRQLVGNRYRDLIDSADSIVLMKSSCDSISSNISSIHHGILHSLSSSSSYSSSETTPPPNPNPYPNNNNNNAKNAKLLSTTNTTTPNANNNNNRANIYGIACRVKYLVDTPENIWGCLDESMYLEAAARYIRAKQVHHSLFLINNNNSSILSNFPLLHHQWQIVESFKSQISQRSRDRLLLLDHHALDLDPDLDLLPIAAYADALAAVAVIDDLDPKQVLSLFLHSRKSCISQKLLTTSSSSSSTATTTSSQVVISTFCQVMKIIQVSVGQVGELFLQVLNDMPLFYKVILGSPPASQLFGGIPNPEEEVRLWKLFRDKLESVTVMLDRNFIAKTCSDWLRSCGKEIVNKINGRYLIDVIANGRELASAEKLIRETMESKQILEGSIEWLKNVFGSEIELPWNRIRELVLEDDADLWDEIFEDAFVHRMRTIVEFGFDELTKVVHVTESIHAIVGTTTGDKVDFQAYLSRSSMAGGVWFMEDKSRKAGSKTTPQENDIHTCLNAYFGAEVSRIRDSVDRRCESVLEDLLSFLESPKASLRLKDLAPYLQDKCYGSISSILVELRNELEHLSAALENGNREHESVPPPAIVVERSLFIGRLLFAFQKHSRHIPVILGSPRLWVNKTVADVSSNSSSLLRQSSLPIDSSISGTPGKRMFDSPKRQTSLATAALFGVDDSSSPQLEELSRTTQDLCIRAHNLWISWVSDELSVILSRNLMQDEALSVATASPLRGWEETVVKQEQSDESQSEMKILLPSMPSLYIMSFLFRACEEIHRVGGHVLDKPILKTFSTTLLEKVIGIYADFLSTEETSGSQVSDKGVLQVLLDLRFAADILSGVDCNTNEEFAKNSKAKFSFRRKQDGNQAKSVIQERVDGLVIRLSQKLDPIDWLTYEPYLWENERQSYLRHAVLFGFFVQLNRMYTDTMQKLPTSSESNIMRCSTVPRFKYLPISAPALSSRGTGKTSISRSVDEVSSRSSWKGYTTEELSRKMDMDDDSSFGVATPFLKSFMQVGSRFGESTLKLGSILTDGQVGRFKDKSAAAMSTFGDILPAQAAGLLSSFTATRSDY